MNVRRELLLKVSVTEKVAVFDDAGKERMQKKS